MAKCERMVSVSTLVTALAKRFGGGTLHYDDLMAFLADVPSVDAVAPVRCGKCEHWVEDDDGRGQEGVCYCHGRRHGLHKRADGYCDRGERKDVFEFKCRHCGKVGVSEQANRRYCDDYCRAEAIREKRRKPEGSSCDFNNGIECTRRGSCNGCGWNPAVEKIRKARFAARAS